MLSTTVSRSQVPVLGDMPIVGVAFRGQDDNVDRTEFIFMITPTIVRDEMLARQAAVASDMTDLAQIGARFGFQAPTVLGRDAELDELLEPASLAWSRALLIEVDFAVEERGFCCQLVLLMPEDAIERMRGVLNRILAAL